MNPTQIIPLSATPAQTVSASLGNQSCEISVYQKRTGLYLDLSVNGALIAAGLLCRDATWLVRAEYSGFVGDLAFVDTQGNDDPAYDGLGSRFLLVWGV